MFGTTWGDAKSLAWLYSASSVLRNYWRFRWLGSQEMTWNNYSFELPAEEEEEAAATLRVVVDAVSLGRPGNGNVLILDSFPHPPAPGWNTIWWGISLWRICGDWAECKWHDMTQPLKAYWEPFWAIPINSPEFPQFPLCLRLSMFSGRPGKWPPDLKSRCQQLDFLRCSAWSGHGTSDRELQLCTTVPLISVDECWWIMMGFAVARHLPDLAVEDFRYGMIQLNTWGLLRRILYYIVEMALKHWEVFLVVNLKIMTRMPLTCFEGKHSLVENEHNERWITLPVPSSSEDLYYPLLRLSCLPPCTVVGTSGHSPPGTKPRCSSLPSSMVNLPLRSSPNSLVLTGVLHGHPVNNMCVYVYIYIYICVCGCVCVSCSSNRYVPFERTRNQSIPNISKHRFHLRWSMINT